MGFFCLLLSNRINLLLRKKFRANRRRLGKLKRVWFALGLHDWCGVKSQSIMIDTNQLSALISAFRVETEKESISPETVGKLLQDIVDLLANASTDAERQILDDWKTMLSQYVVVYDVAHATGMVDMEHMFLTLKGRSLRNGATFTSSVPLSAATYMQTGVMSASHVRTLLRRNLYST